MVTTTKRNALLIAALLCVFAAFDLLGHRDTQYFWAKLIGVLALSATLVLATRNREYYDTFLAVLAALFTLFAIAMTTANRNAPHWWVFFGGFVGAAALFVLLTRKEVATLVAIAAIVLSRIVIYLAMK